MAADKFSDDGKMDEGQGRAGRSNLRPRKTDYLNFSRRLRLIARGSSNCSASIPSLCKWRRYSLNRSGILNFFFFLRTQVFLEFSFGLNYSPVSFGELDVNLEKKERKNVRRR